MRQKIQKNVLSRNWNFSQHPPIHHHLLKIFDITSLNWSRMQGVHTADNDKAQGWDTFFDVHQSTSTAQTAFSRYRHHTFLAAHADGVALDHDKKLAFLTFNRPSAQSDLFPPALGYFFSSLARTIHSFATYFWHMLVCIAVLRYEPRIKNRTHCINKPSQVQRAKTWHLKYHGQLCAKAWSQIRKYSNHDGAACTKEAHRSRTGKTHENVQIPLPGEITACWGITNLLRQNSRTAKRGVLSYPADSVLSIALHSEASFVASCATKTALFVCTMHRIDLPCGCPGGTEVPTRMSVPEERSERNSLAPPIENFSPNSGFPGKQVAEKNLGERTTVCQEITKVRQNKKVWLLFQLNAVHHRMFCAKSGGQRDEQLDATCIRTESICIGVSNVAVGCFVVVQA